MKTENKNTFSKKERIIELSSQPFYMQTNGAPNKTVIAKIIRSEFGNCSRQYVQQVIKQKVINDKNRIGF